MSFQDIQGAVHQAWEFAWPPVVLLLIMIVLFLWIAPTAALRSRSALEKVVTTDRIRKTRAHLRLWGLGKLLPIMTAFGMIFLLYFVNRSVRSIGDLLPPKIVHRADYLVARYGDPRMLGCVATRYTNNEESGRHLPSGILGRITRDILSVGESARGVQAWEGKVHKAHATWGAAKFLFLWVIVCMVIQRLAHDRLRWRTAFVFFVVLTLVATGALVNYVYALQQSYYQNLSEAEAKLLTSKECRTYVLTNTERKSLNSYRENRSDARWWWLSMESVFTRFTWIYREVIRGGA